MGLNKIMKILLASNGKFAIEEGYKLLDIPNEQIRIGYVTTASKGSKDLSYLERHRQEMKQMGYMYEEFDIEGKSKEEIFNFFADKNVIHMEGGNTFYLLKAIRETKFDEVLKTLLDNGLTYVGVSAGAYIMCPTIEVASWRKNKKEEWCGLTDFKALNYVPYLFKVHFTDDMEALVKEKMKTLEYPLRILKDGQGILLENGKESFIGEGEEIKLKPIKEEINEIRNTKIF